MMSSSIRSENDSYSRKSSKRSIFNTGVLLLEDAERAPEYLRITIDSDPDEPDPVEDDPSDSEEDVVVLGEKRPTYQEITLEEDDEGEVEERIVEIEKEGPPQQIEEEALFKCTYCDKSFRVESLLKFHIKMHNSSIAISSKESESSSPTSSTSHNSEQMVDDRRKKRRRHSVDNQDRSKLKVTSKSPSKHKSRQEKYKSHKHKKQKRTIST